MNIVLGSLFRSSAGFHINRYFRQVARLADRCATLGHTLTLRLVWGDSQDKTAEELHNCAVALMYEGGIKGFELVERSHGGPVFGSTEETARLKALSYVANGFFESVGAAFDAAIYVESDLLWEPSVFTRLLDQLRPGVDIVSPLVFAGEAFYDIWGFRALDGERFGPFHPFHSSVRFDELTEVSSVGSCLVMRGTVARNCRIRNEYCLVGFCEDARAQGYYVYVDAQERIHHP